MIHRDLKKCMATLLMGLLATVTAQAYDFEKDGIFYNVTSLEDLTVEVTKSTSGVNNSDYTGAITIPETVEWNNKTFVVTAIGKNAFYNSTITSINLPASVMEIGDGAFDGCPKLDSIVIPNNVTQIDLGAFSYCENLKSVVLPDSLEYISGRAFYNCTSLTSIVIPDKVTQSVLKHFVDAKV